MWLNFWETQRDLRGLEEKCQRVSQNTVFPHCVFQFCSFYHHSCKLVPLHLNVCCVFQGFFWLVHQEQGRLFLPRLLQARLEYRSFSVLVLSLMKCLLVLGLHVSEISFVSASNYNFAMQCRQGCSCLEKCIFLGIHVHVESHEKIEYQLKWFNSTGFHWTPISIKVMFNVSNFCSDGYNSRLFVWFQLQLGNMHLA